MRIAIAVTLALLVVGGAWGVYSIFEAGRAARRIQSLNNLRNVGLANFNFTSGNEGRFPRGVLRDEAGRALHGWPAQLLPNLDAVVLYREIDFEKPWDDPTNRTGMKTRLSVFEYPGIAQADTNGYAPTHYAANQHLIGDHDPPSFEEVEAADGLGFTILVGEAGSGYRPWGDTENFRDPALGFGQSATQFGSPLGTGQPVHVGFADGSVRPMNPNTDPAVLRALATPNGGEEMNPHVRW